MVYLGIMECYGVCDLLFLAFFYFFIKLSIQASPGFLIPLEQASRAQLAVEDMS
jgi:hypothetical protein